MTNIILNNEFSSGCLLLEWKWLKPECNAYSGYLMCTPSMAWSFESYENNKLGTPGNEIYDPIVCCASVNYISFHVMASCAMSGFFLLIILREFFPL